MDKQQFRFWALVSICALIWLDRLVLGALHATIGDLTCRQLPGGCNLLSVIVLGCIILASQFGGVIAVCCIVHARARRLGFHPAWTLVVVYWAMGTKVFLMGTAYTVGDPLPVDPAFDAIGIPTHFFFLFVFTYFLAFSSRPKPFSSGLITMIAWPSAAAAAMLATQTSLGPVMLWASLGVFTFALTYLLLDQRLHSDTNPPIGAPT